MSNNHQQNSPKYELDSLEENAETTQFFDTETFKEIDTLAEVKSKMNTLKNHMWPKEAGETGDYIYDIDAGRLARYAGEPSTVEKNAYNTADVLYTHLAMRLALALRSNKTDLPDITSIDDFEALAIKQSELPAGARSNAAKDINHAIEKIRQVLGSDFGDTPQKSIGGKLKTVVDDMIADYREKKVLKEKQNAKRRGGSADNTLAWTAGGAALGKFIGNNKTAGIGAALGAIGSVASDTIDTNKSAGTNIKNVVLKAAKNIGKEAPNMRTLHNTHKEFKGFFKDLGVDSRAGQNGAALVSEVVIAGFTVIKIIPWLWKTVLGAGGDIVTGAVKDKAGVVKENWKRSALTALGLGAATYGAHYLGDEHQAELNREEREEAIKRKQNGAENGLLEKELIGDVLVINNYENDDSNEEDKEYLKYTLLSTLVDLETLNVDNVGRLEKIFNSVDELQGKKHRNVDIKVGSYTLQRRKNANSNAISYYIKGRDFGNAYYKVDVSVDNNNNKKVQKLTKYTVSANGNYKAGTPQKIV